MKRHPIRRAIRWQTIVAIALLGWSSDAVYSHEMWVKASKSIVKPGSEVSLNLYVGRQFKGDELTYNPSRFQHYRVITSTAQTPILGHYGDSPAGRVKSVAAGLNIVSYLSKQQYIQFQDASKWQTYLDYEGLEDVAQFYRQNGFPPSGLREHFQRCSRAVIWGEPQSEASLAEAAKADRPTGMPLELILLDNPFTNSAKRVALKLLYLSKPIANIQVRVFYRPSDETDQVVDAIARTDQHGAVILPRFGPGDYLFNAVHLIPVAPGQQADWQSYWASLSVTLE